MFITIIVSWNVIILCKRKKIQCADVADASLAKPRLGEAPEVAQRVFATDAADDAGVVHGPSVVTPAQHVPFVVGQLVCAAHLPAPYQYH